MSQAIKWLNDNAQIGNANIEINKKFMKMLEETGRLFPDKRTFFKKYYTVDHLKLYAHDVKPR